MIHIRKQGDGEYLYFDHAVDDDGDDGGGEDDEEEDSDGHGLEQYDAKR